MKKFRSSRIACTCSRRPYLAALQAAAVRARLPSGLRGQVVPGSHGLQPPGILCTVQPAPGQVIMSISGAAASACSCIGVQTHACPFVLPIGLRLILQEEVWFGIVRSSSFSSSRTGWCTHAHAFSGCVWHPGTACCCFGRASLRYLVFTYGRFFDHLHNLRAPSVHE